MTRPVKPETIFKFGNNGVRSHMSLVNIDSSSTASRLRGAPQQRLSAPFPNDRVFQLLRPRAKMSFVRRFLVLCSDPLWAPLRRRPRWMNTFYARATSITRSPARRLIRLLQRSFLFCNKPRRCQCHILKSFEPVQNISNCFTIIVQ